MNEDPHIQNDGGLPQLDRYLRALGDRQRRHILYYLEDQQVTTLEALARHLAAQDTDQSPSAITEAEYESIHIELHHNHLPRLDDYGLIDYDERTSEVRLAEPSRVFAVLLQLLRFIEQQS